MSSSASARARRAPWVDVRFLLGIVLVVASIVGVWFVVSAARQTTPAIAAARTLIPGDVIAATDVRVVEVALGALGESYLRPDDLAIGAIATRTVAAGELVPYDAVGAGEDAATTVVVLHSSTDVPASVDTGSVVEVWAAPLLERGVHDTPSILVPDATVVSVARDEAVVGRDEVALEVVIPRADVSAVLTAMSDESALSVVPTVGGDR
ncbi:SAF domain-containing protein [Microbacterium xanthum]|uniref:SAF domain-containing protein n=1 Tax=Microbacterium xanthum TaxID=3079794 RepID=UPI002AD29F97|nr:SAF domain-containing protein [Microbacterium sp. KSW-48]MDZ8171103.1 flagella basal body P-ring formation protein FlgA [Microbacterium sp. KSW-48]